MASKRRRSSSAVAGAAGCGPFGFFLALGAIWLLVQYWWVLLIVFGVVGLTVAIVRFARTPTPPVMARSPKSARPLEPPPVMTPRSPALVSEELAVQMRATKQVRHIRDMQEWDYEWIRLTHPEKSNRELSVMANAHFAGGRSIGVNYQRARLLDSGSDQPAEGVGMRPEHHQPAKGESSNEHVLSGISDEPDHVRRAILSRFHADLVQLNEARGAQSRDGARPAPLTEDQIASWSLAFRKRPEEASELLAGDPRTMWAWAKYLESRHPLYVSYDDAGQVLAAIPPGDHVEIFAGVAISPDRPRRGNDALPPEARFAARTFDSWILPSSGQHAETIPDSNTKRFLSMGGSIVDPVAESHFRMADGRNLWAYIDKETYRWFKEGVGGLILRLPDSPTAPLPPELGRGLLRPSPKTASPSRLIGDWHTAEDVALWHMSGPLGFFGSQLTGGVSDRGVDVEHPEAVAQVKMQANPVGSPQIRQLRGARPHLRNHVFYSTSGFTRAAIAEAEETGVALFTMDDGARVSPHGAHAKRLTLEGHQRHGGDDALVAEYVGSVVQRVHKAKTNYGSQDAWWALREPDGADWDRITRAQSYLKGATAAVSWHPRIGVDTHKAVVSHFRNADLRAAFFCQVLGLSYPGDEPLSRRKPPTAADFY